MTEKLTDEQLRYIVTNDTNGTACLLAAELLALRAERVKLEAGMDKATIEFWTEAATRTAYKDEGLRLLGIDVEQYWSDQRSRLPSGFSITGSLRAERAKPTQSDAERAEDVLCRISKLVRNRDHDRRQITNAFASIRAEGSAERAKIEGALRKCRPLIGCFPFQSAADLVEEVESLIGKYDWFAQPAESGATERKCPACGADANRPRCLNEYEDCPRFDDEGAKP